MVLKQTYCASFQELTMSGSPSALTDFVLFTLHLAHIHHQSLAKLGSVQFAVHLGRTVQESMKISMEKTLSQGIFYLYLNQDREKSHHCVIFPGCKSNKHEPKNLGY